MDLCSSALANKPLRFLARFVVIGLLLGKRSLVDNILNDLELFVQQYAQSSQRASSPFPDVADWPRVVSELKSFLCADRWVLMEKEALQSLEESLPSEIDRSIGFSCRLSRRMRFVPRPIPSTSSPGSANNSPSSSSLRSVPFSISFGYAVLAGCKRRQVKFSELTVDVFRMMQALEGSVTRDAKGNEMIIDEDADDSEVAQDVNLNALSSSNASQTPQGYSLLLLSVRNIFIGMTCNLGCFFLFMTIILHFFC